MYAHTKSVNKFFPLDKTILQKPVVKIANIQQRNSDYHFAKHIHDNIEIYLILTGSCHMVVGLEKIICNAGDFILILPNIPHSFDIPAGASCSFAHIHFYPEMFSLLHVEPTPGFSLDLLSSLKLHQQNFYFFSADAFLYYMMEHIIELAKQPSPYTIACSNLAVTELMVHLLGLYQKQQHLFSSLEAVQNQYVMHTLKYIHENYSTKFLVGNIAAQLNISTRYLRKLFVHYMHINIQSYIKIFRMNQAVDLMVHTNLNLTEIAAAVGINDSQYFSKLFRSTIGSVPSEYRKILKNVGE